MRLLIVVWCVCSVSSFKLFPLAIEPQVQDIEVITESSVAETVVFTNVPMPNGAPKVVESTSDSTFLSASAVDSSTSDTAPVSNSLSESSNASSKPTDSKLDLSSSADIATDKKTSSESVLDASGTKSLSEFTTESIAVILVNSSLVSSHQSESAANVADIATDKKTSSESVLDASGTISLSELTTESVTEILASSDLISSNQSESAANAASSSESAKASTKSAITSIRLTESAADTSSLFDSTEDSKLSEAESTSTILLETSNTSTDLSAIDSATLSAKATLSQSDSAVDSVSLSESAKASTISPDLTNSQIDTTSTSTSSPDLEMDLISSFETTTEDLSFLSVELLPPKTEYRKNEPDPRYDY